MRFRTCSNRTFDHIERVFAPRPKTAGTSRSSQCFARCSTRCGPSGPSLGYLACCSPRFTHLAEALREDLVKAGVTRASLHVRRAGSPPIRFHAPRTAGITYMAISGDSDQDVRERAGHADFETTLLYIRRGHLALSSAAIGRPYTALPACLLGESSSGSGESSQTSSFSDDSISLSQRDFFKKVRSWRRDSNPRRQPWQAPNKPS